MIRDIFLDVDDTILDFGRAEREALASALSQMGVEVNEEALHCYHEVNLAHWKMLERGEITRERLLVRRLVAEELTDREADIIRRRYGLDGHPPQTQRQVAEVYHISRSYVSRLEKKALGKLEEALREKL